MRWVLFCGFLSGCTSVQFAPARVAQTYPSRTPAERIELYRSERPARKFIEIGMVTACCSQDPNLLVGLLRKQAELRGGDALVDFEFAAAGQVTATVLRFE